MRLHDAISVALGVGLVAAIGNAQAIDFEQGDVTGSLVSTLSTGFQVRLQNPDPSLNTYANTVFFPKKFMGDENFRKGDINSFTIKGIHELELLFPNQWSFFGRVDWLADWGALSNAEFGFPDKSRDVLNFDPRLLDLYIEKGFELGGRYGQVRVGNQVLNWGESLFFFGGINYATNPVDIGRIVLPGSQIKELLLPVPMISTSLGLTDEVSMEAYYQFGWKGDQFPAVGSMWSTSAFIGPGSKEALDEIFPTFGLGGYAGSKDADNQGQWGVSFKYQFPESGTEIGAYYARYHEKFPWFYWDANLNAGHTYAEDIDLWAMSFNTDAGNWSLSGELSYRPNDVIALDPFGGCMAGGDCLRKQKRWGIDLVAVHQLAPSTEFGWLLRGLGAQGGLLMAEVGGFKFPGLDPAGTDALVALDATSDYSWGYAVEANVAYEGTVIPGWTMTPGVFYRQGVHGSSQELLGWWRDDVKEANVYLTFFNPSNNVSASINWLPYWGGSPGRINDHGDHDVLSASIGITF